ncbi:hypothetical protein ACRAWG_06370 [Methylobacterium sp. P31]
MGELRRVGLVDRGHEFVADAREGRGAVMSIDDAGRRRCRRVDDVVGEIAPGVARRFARMMIEGEMAGFDVRQIGDDVAIRDRDNAILHVLGMNELDLVDQVEFVQQHAADETVKVATRHKAELLLRHGGALFGLMQECPSAC